jgi:hypothetical protein
LGKLIQPRSPKTLDETFTLYEEPGPFLARLAVELGKRQYTLRSQSDDTAVFQREKTKWIGIAFGGTKKNVKTVSVEFSAPIVSGQRTVHVIGDDGRLTDLIRWFAERELPSG